jgi:hypothetical protein
MIQARGVCGNPGQVDNAVLPTVAFTLGYAF